MKYAEVNDMSVFKKLNTKSWEDISKNVMVNMVNTKYLSQYGNPISKEMLDLSMVYVLHEKINDIEHIYMLTKKDLKKYKTTLKTLHNVATQNTLTYRYRRLITFSESCLMENDLYPVMRMPEHAALSSSGKGVNGIIMDVEENGKENFLVLCNKNSPYGTASMFMHETLYEVYERFNKENFYIVPISRHQVWYIRASYVTHKKSTLYAESDLIDMLEDFNDNKNTNWQDILSYKIYHFIGDDGACIVPIQI